MDIPVFYERPNKAEKITFYILVIASCALHIAVLFASMSLQLFARPRIDPSKIYDVRMIDLKDLPFGVKNQFGGEIGPKGTIGKTPGGRQPKLPTVKSPETKPEPEPPKAEPPKVEPPKVEKPAPEPEVKPPPETKPPVPEPKIESPIKPPSTDKSDDKNAGGRQKQPLQPEYDNGFRVPSSDKKKPPDKPKPNAGGNAKGNPRSAAPPSFESRWEGADSLGMISKKTTKGTEYHFEQFAGGPGAGQGGGQGGEDYGFSGGSANAGSMLLDNVNFQFLYYLAIIKDKVGQNWNPPSGAGKAGKTTKVVIYFRIFKDGKVAMIQVETGSGIGMMDQSALRAIQASSPFPPLPKEYGEDILGVHFGFECTF